MRGGEFGHSSCNPPAAHHLPALLPSLCDDVTSFSSKGRSWGLHWHPRPPHSFTPWGGNCHFKVVGWSNAWTKGFPPPTALVSVKNCVTPPPCSSHHLQTAWSTVTTITTISSDYWQISPTEHHCSFYVPECCKTSNSTCKQHMVLIIHRRSTFSVACLCLQLSKHVTSPKLLRPWSCSSIRVLAWASFLILKSPLCMLLLFILQSSLDLF